MKKKPNNVVPVTQVESLIYLLRGQKVMTDTDLAALYGVEARVLNQAVKRNFSRFPDDFMFQLSNEEFAVLMRSQIVTASPANSSQIVMSSKATSKNANKIKDFAKSNSSHGSVPSSAMRSQIVIASKRNIRFRPYVFTEQGVAMLSSVLRSERAVQVNIEIMRAFVKIRQWLASNADLAARLHALEKKYNRQFKAVFDAIHELMEPPVPLKPTHGREIGFHTQLTLPVKKKSRPRKS